MGFDPPTGLHFGHNGMDMIFRGIDMDGDSSDAFSSSRLQGKGGLVLCGTSPDGCIETTIATAKARGIPTYIVAGAVWLLGEVPEGVSVLDLSLTGNC
jgi:hypothetical protein